MEGSLKNYYCECDVSVNSITLIIYRFSPQMVLCWYGSRKKVYLNNLNNKKITTRKKSKEVL